MDNGEESEESEEIEESALTLDGDGEPLPEAERKCMEAAATEIIDSFSRLGE